MIEKYFNFGWFICLAIYTCITQPHFALFQYQNHRRSFERLLRVLSTLYTFFSVFAHLQTICFLFSLGFISLPFRSMWCVSTLRSILCIDKVRIKLASLKYTIMMAMFNISSYWWKRKVAEMDNDSAFRYSIIMLKLS